MPEDSKAKKAKQDKPYRPYAGPSAAELEPKIASLLPGLRIYFAQDPHYTREQIEAMMFQENQRQGRIEEKLAKGEAVTEAETKSSLPSQGEIDYILDNEKITQQLRQNFAVDILRRLDNYARATIAEGTFTEKWPLILDQVARYDNAVAFHGAYAVLQDNFGDAGTLDEKPEFMQAARQAFRPYHDQYVNLLENHFYGALTEKKFSEQWPEKIDEALRIDPAVATRGVARFFARPMAALDPQNFMTACQTARKACARAAETGDALLAADTLGKVLFRVVQAGRAGALEQKDFFALATEMQADQEKFILLSVDQLSEKFAKEQAEGGNPALAGQARADLTRVLSQYFYVAEGKGALASEWSAVMDKISALDAGVAVEAADYYFAKPAKSVSLADFMITAAKTKELSEKAAAQGYNASAAEALANVLGHLRENANNERLPVEKRDEFSALGVSVSALEETIISKGIAESLADLMMSDAELAQRTQNDPSFSDARSEDRLLLLLDEFFYQTMKKGTVATEWPAKLEEITAGDSEIAARAARAFFVTPKAMIGSLDDFKAVCDAAAKASMAAHDQGFNFSAAETLSAMVRSINRNVEGIEADAETQKNFPDVLRALRDLKSAVGQNLEDVMHSWEETVSEKPDDPRDAEQIQRAKETYLAFLNTLTPAADAVPPPSAPPSNPAPAGP